MTKKFLPCIGAAMIAASPFAGAAYELVYDAEGTNSAPSCIFYRLNRFNSAIDIGGRRYGVYEETPLGSGMFVAPGDRNYAGTNDGRDTTLKIFAGGDALATFRAGRLVRFVRDGIDEEKERDQAMLALRTERRKREKTMRTKTSESELAWGYWAKSGRLRLFYPNPNSTGTLFAVLALPFFALMLNARRSCLRLIGAIAFTAALTALYCTHSRGSMLAAILGIAVLLCARIKELKSEKIRRGIFLSAAIAVVALVVFSPKIAVCLGAGEKGNSERISAWLDAPRMMVAAPGGWHSPAGYAWCDWYQDTKDSFSTKYMVNTHLNWLVEHGNTERFAYVAAWLFLMVALTLAARNDGALALSAWLAFGTGLWFSSVGYEATLWIAPAMVSIPLIYRVVPRIRRRTAAMALLRKSLLCLGFALPVAGLLIGSMLALGEHLEKRADLPYYVNRVDEGVKIGQGEAKVWLLCDKTILGGGHRGVIGKDVRDYYKVHKDAPAMIVSTSLSVIPQNTERLILAGRPADAYISAFADPAKRCGLPTAKHLVLISPRKSWNALPPALTETGDVKYIAGDLALHDLLHGKNAPAWVQIAAGCALYIPDWMERSFL